MNITIVQQPALRVFGLKAADGPEGIMSVWQTVSTRSDMKERNCYGVFYPGEDQCIAYYAGYEAGADETVPQDLTVLEVPAGAYAQTVLLDWREHLDQIAQLFGQLGAEAPNVEKKRPCIEAYVTPTELHLRVPVSRS